VVRELLSEASKIHLDSRELGSAFNPYGEAMQSNDRFFHGESRQRYYVSKNIVERRSDRDDEYGAIHLPYLGLQNNASDSQSSLAS
jgi:hypothetical protein